ncbi:MAG: YncE family protein [Dissulfurispiraceae bacterium]|jgi:DNA-binding beta-propeller fold protein YncE
MRQKLSVLILGLLIIAGLVVFGGASKNSIAAMDMSGESCYTMPGDTIEAKVVTPQDITFNGIAYIAGHGGHVAVIDMRTMKSPTDLEKGRIVLTEAGSEMEGKIAGMSFEEVKKSGGTHGQVLINENGKKFMIAGTLSGDVYKIDMATGKKEGPIKVGEKFCGAILGPDGKIYLEDMANGSVYTWDSATLKTVDKMPVGAAVCGIQWTKNAKKAYITDMPLGKVYVYDWTTKKLVKTITSPELTFIHQDRMTPDGKYLWVSAPNEFDPGLKPGTHKSQVIVIDTTKDEIVKRIILPDSVRPHDFAFTADGKYALLTSRTYADDSQLNVMDLKNANIVRQVSACASCHKENGVEVKVDKGSPLLCGIDVDWNPGK